MNLLNLSFFFSSFDALILHQIRDRFRKYPRIGIEAALTKQYRSISIEFNTLSTFIDER